MDIFRHAIIVLVMVLLLVSASACTSSPSTPQLIEPSYSYVREGLRLSDGMFVSNTALTAVEFSEYTP